MKRILTYIIFIYIGITGMNTVGTAQTRKFFSPDNGLSNSLVNRIYQDRRGFIWIATEHGLNKFDGMRFTVYKDIPDSDSSAVVYNYFKVLFEDKDGNLLAGTIYGLLKYDEATDSFDALRMMRDGKVVYPHITSITQVDNGDIWLTTSGQGVFSARRGTFVFHCEEKVTQSLSSVFLNSICEDSQSNIWIGTENDGLNCYHPREGTTDVFRFPDLGSNIISAIEEDNAGNMYVGTLTQGLYRYIPGTRRFQHIPHRDGMKLFIKSLKSDYQDRLYIGTDGQGLMVYNARSNQIEPHEISSAPFDTSKGKIHSILFDKNRNLWLGFYQKGIIFIPTAESRFDYYGYRLLRDNPIGSCSVTSIRGDREGILWVGTDNDGLYGLDFKGRRVAHFHKTASPHSAPDIIHSIYEDTDGYLWLGSYTNGLSRLDPRTGYCEYLPAFSEIKIFCVTEDRDRNILVGSLGSGFFILDKAGNILAHYESSKREMDILTEDELANDWITYMSTDRDGLVWIAHNKGLSCFDPVRKTFLTFSGKNNLMPGNVARILMEDHEGRIWIGGSQGLYCFNKETEEMGLFTTADGLANEVVCGICEDNEYNLWISTFDGISKYNRAGKRFINYYADDGLQGNEFSVRAMYKDRYGKIYFGGINGVTGFYAAEIIEERQELSVLLANFYSGNRPVRKGDLSGKYEIVSTSVLDAGKFTLNYTDNAFSLELSTLDFQHPERVSYQYQMEGLDTGWSVTAPGSNRITYNNMEPGEYKFHAKVSGNSSSPVKTILITIIPPWYRTWLAYACYWLLGTLLAYGIAAFIMARIRYRHELIEKGHAEQITEAKLQFFINISHEIRTPMTLIINPLEKLIGEDRDEGRQPAYRMIYRNAQRILRLINQMMDIRKLDEGKMKLKYRETDMVAFINDLMHTFEYQAEKKHITFSFEHEMDRLDVWIDLNNFDKVLLNILSNAFKFTPENGAITVELSLTVDGFVEISVSDTGIGIDEDKIEKIFERFYQVENEYTRLHSGTGIGLHLSRSLVELHRGTLYAENRADTKGSRFVIRLPLGNSHIRPGELDDSAEANAFALPHKESRTPTDTFEQDGDKGKAARAKTKYRILVVDDEEDILHYLGKELSGDYHLQKTRNGKEALAYILKEKPDLIISDVMMPGMDGITLVRKIKQNINISHIPTILLTAKSGTEDQLEGLEMGADAYLVKPFNTGVLKQTIANLLTKHERLMNKYSGKELQEDKMQRVELKSSDELLMEKTMVFIHQNLSNPKLNNAMIAAHAGMSRVHLFRKLKELTNQSPGEFIRNIRLRQAALLLDSKKLSIAEVAYATGFPTPAQFSASFHSFYGVSPSGYVSNKKGMG